MTNQLTAQMNTILANWIVLYMKFHHYHWFIKGKHFFVLHDIFEKLYNEAAINIDELAERLLALDKKPISTLKAALDHSTIEEQNIEQTEQEMVNETIQDIKKMVTELKKGIELAEENNDDVTADLFISMTHNLEKHLWMFKSFLEV